ncbi:hypothetical protein PI125_g13343 [Phytophthora idaei]|nr:hypothetical protein PI125_g13343 [Phytophthora idaei]
MESVGTSTHAEVVGEHDPDDLDFPTANRAAIATTTGGSGPAPVIQGVRISAMSDLKEFTGSVQDEDRARSWLSKVKSAFLRDQAPDEEKCLTFVGYYRQLSRSTRNKRNDLLRSFQTQYCGLGVSVAWQYCQVRKRSG